MFICCIVFDCSMVWQQGDDFDVFQQYLVVDGGMFVVGEVWVLLFGWRFGVDCCIRCIGNDVVGVVLFDYLVWVGLWMLVEQGLLGGQFGGVGLGLVYCLQGVVIGGVGYWVYFRGCGLLLLLLWFWVVLVWLLYGLVIVCQYWKIGFGMFVL